MRTLVIVIVVIVALAGVGAAAYKPAMEYWEQRNAPKWKMAEVAEGDIISVVNATGTIKPVEQISVGSFVSGPIDPEFRFFDKDGGVARDKNGDEKRIADFNDPVVEKQVLARIDPRIYKANRDRDKANLDTKKADVLRFRALRNQAFNDNERAKSLRAEDEKKNKEKKGYISQAEMDKFNFGLQSLEAQVALAEAAVEQADAQLKFSQLQLDYTEITSPVNGVIIHRKIDPGQTVAAQFQTPEMFIIAKDLKKMHVHASVDEADIGLINEAQRRKLPVTFTVDAWNDLFKGEIEEIRLASVTTQNVVTYPVVVGAPNPEQKLLPGMTASISFEVDRRDDVLKIPNSALRFFPQPGHVRPEDKPLLEGRQSQNDDHEVTDTGLSAQDRAKAQKNRSKRHVWIQDRHKLRAVEVQTGLSDSQYTEVVAGELKKGDKLVIGIQPVIVGWGQ
jgi:HlyD family secretion protein